MNEPYNTLSSMLDDMTTALQEYACQHDTTLLPSVQARISSIIDAMHLLQFQLEHAFDEREHGQN